MTQRSLETVNAVVASGWIRLRFGVQAQDAVHSFEPGTPNPEPETRAKTPISQGSALCGVVRYLESSDRQAAEELGNPAL